MYTFLFNRFYTKWYFAHGQLISVDGRFWPYSYWWPWFPVSMLIQVSFSRFPLNQTQSPIIWFASSLSAFFVETQIYCILRRGSACFVSPAYPSYRVRSFMQGHWLSIAGDVRHGPWVVFIFATWRKGLWQLSDLQTESKWRWIRWVFVRLVRAWVSVL